MQGFDKGEWKCNSLATDQWCWRWLVSGFFFWRESWGCGRRGPSTRRWQVLLVFVSAPVIFGRSLAQAIEPFYSPLFLFQHSQLMAMAEQCNIDYSPPLTAKNIEPIVHDDFPEAWTGPQTAGALTSFDVFAFIVNKMVGTGIFTVPPTILLLTHSRQITIILWSLGFVYAIVRYVAPSSTRWNLTSTISSTFLYLAFCAVLPYSTGELNYVSAEPWSRRCVLSSLIALDWWGHLVWSKIEASSSDPQPVWRRPSGIHSLLFFIRRSFQ